MMSLKLYKKINIPHTVHEEIGSGAFGKVYKAIECGCKKGRERTFALKLVTCNGNDELQAAEREVKSMTSLEHPNIVKLLSFGVKQEREFEVIFSLLMEYCPDGNLNDRLRRESSRATSLRWMRQIVAAVVYLHGENIVHQDLKPDNILLTADGTIKVADFGLAQRFARRDDCQTWYSYYLNQGVGALCYVAPEILDERHTWRVDIFSLGVIFHAILERRVATVRGKQCYGVFVTAKDGSQRLLGIQMHDQKRDIAVPFSGRRRKLIEKALKYNPERRPTAAEIQRVLNSRWQRWRSLNML